MQARDHDRIAGVMLDALDLIRYGTGCDCTNAYARREASECRMCRIDRELGEAVALLAQYRKG